MLNSSFIIPHSSFHSLRQLDRTSAALRRPRMKVRILLATLKNLGPSSNLEGPLVCTQEMRVQIPPASIRLASLAHGRPWRALRQRFIKLRKRRVRLSGQAPVSKTGTAQPGHGGSTPSPSADRVWRVGRAVDRAAVLMRIPGKTWDRGSNPLPSAGRVSQSRSRHSSDG